MEFWRLVSPAGFETPMLMGHHNHLLCAAAVLLAVLAAWILLPVTERFHETRSRARFVWLAIGSVAMGVGIWAMHFTAMLAFSLPVPIRYAWWPTVISIAPAIAATASCVVLLRPARMDAKSLHLAAALMAAGIGSMHYIGMEAIIAPAAMYYDPSYFALSLIAAYTAALFGLYAYVRLLARLRLVWFARLVGSTILGAAVSSMHFIAMQATYFQALPGAANGFDASPHSGLMLAVIAGAGLILCMVFLGSAVGKKLEFLERTLRTSEARFRSLAETTPVAIFTFDAERVTYANAAVSSITGRANEDVLKLPLEAVFGAELARLAGECLREGSSGERAVHQQLKICAADGSQHWLHFSIAVAVLDDRLTGVGSAVDVSEQKEAELRMQRLAFTDSLTSVANRALFMDRLQHHLHLMDRAQPPRSCVMLLDLDNFKSINDTFGHHCGDAVLVEVAARLRALVQPADTIARIGGDEFVLLVEDADYDAGDLALADRILETLARPVLTDSYEIELGASIGIVALESAYQVPDQVLLDADVALYRAKERGRAQWVYFDNELGASAKRSRILLSELRVALRENRLKLKYQPIVSASGADINGFEALARWQRENGESVSPAEFIPLAEDAGLIVDIDLWAVAAAAEQLSQFIHEGHWDGYVSVNLASASIRDDRLVSCVRALVRRYGFAHGQLMLEITERTLVDDTGETLTRLNQLIDAGCKLMIDDFGTGYSSLAYLHRFPCSTVKIDQSFVADIAGEQGGTISVIKSIGALAKALELKVVAEGVETGMQWRTLTDLGIDQLQGYLFGKPKSGDAVLRSLRKAHLLEVVENSAIMRVLRRGDATA